MNEKVIKVAPGMPMLLLNLAMYVIATWLIFVADKNPSWWVITLIIVLFSVAAIHAIGFFTVEPNGSKVLLLFGKYVGTVKDAGFHWTNPFRTKRNLSRRVRTLNGEKLKVNDLAGNPIEIAIVVVWKVIDTYSASFEVEDYEKYVALQSETALRTSAGSYPYDAEEHIESLRQNAQSVSDHIQTELQNKLRVAGIEVIEARIAHLAYSPEIAGAMLRRQQADAVIAARQKIVDGAVGMVEMAIQSFEKEGVVELDEERKANMVSNLMVVLCSENSAQPVINAGSLY